jgi:hypothetical protein
MGLGPRYTREETEWLIKRRQTQEPWKTTHAVFNAHFHAQRPRGLNSLQQHMTRKDPAYTRELLKWDDQPKLWAQSRLKKDRNWNTIYKDYLTECPGPHRSQAAFQSMAASVELEESERIYTEEENDFLKAYRPCIPSQEAFQRLHEVYETRFPTTTRSLRSIIKQTDILDKSQRPLKHSWRGVQVRRTLAQLDKGSVVDQFRAQFPRVRKSASTIQSMAQQLRLSQDGRIHRGRHWTREEIQGLKSIVDR